MTSEYRRLMNIMEGGNVFKDEKKIPVTQRINKADVVPTLKWLEKVINWPLVNYMLGTTGNKETSGDLDVAIDQNKVTKDEMVNRLTKWCEENGLNPKGYIKKTGINVHFKTPINGDPKNGFVQTDLMFGNPKWMKWGLRGAADNSPFKGMHRNIVINSMAKPNGYSWSGAAGLKDRETKKVVTHDPNKVAKLLLGPTATMADLESVETIVAKARTLPNFEELMAMAVETLAKDNLMLPIAENADFHNNDSDAYFLARLRNKIMSTGSSMLNEHKVLMEGARIEHLEDLVLVEGSRGIQRAIASLKDLANNNTESMSIKLDGKPAVCFGRDTDGRFVLTDKAGFKAKGYDGMAKSPEDIVKIMSMRKGDRSELNAMYAKLFPIFEKLFPKNFTGFFFGDLLYSDTPTKNKNGKLQFTPNIVTYEVDPDSNVGQTIANSEAGIVIHGYFEDKNAELVPLSGQQKQLNKVSDVWLTTPEFSSKPNVQLDTKSIKRIESVLSKSDAIDKFLDPTDLRAKKMVVLPALLKQYINSKVRDGSFENLASDFVSWLSTSRASSGQQQRIIEHLREHKEGYVAIFKSFVYITQAKTDIINQLDNQTGDISASIAGSKGHEGYVSNTTDGMIKYVDRLKFTSLNFNTNNPKT